MKAVLVATDSATWSGRRDHAMLMTAYSTGARVSEPWACAGPTPTSLRSSGR